MLTALLMLISVSPVSPVTAESSLSPERIRLVQQHEAMETRAQHREIVRVQPISTLSPVEERQQTAYRAEKLVSVQETL